MQILKKITLLAFILSAFAVGAMAQNVNVAATGGTASATYATLTAAFDAVNAGTHTGAVTISIAASTTEPANTSAVLNSSGAGSASYTSVLIRPTADGITITGTGGAAGACGGKGLIELNGADNVTIDGDNPNSAGTNRNLTLTDTCTGTYTSVVRIALAATIVTSADNVTIRNLVINGSAPGRNISTATSTTAVENLTYGILASSGGSTVSAATAPSTVTSTTATIGTGATATNLTIDNNAVNSAARAVAIQGSATTVFPGLTISGNVIGNPTAGAVDQVYSFGITAQGSTNAVIRTNTVYVESFLATSIRGIDTGSVSATGTGFTFERNQVNRVVNSSTGGQGAYGINLASGANHIVRNNFVSGVINVANATFSTTFGAFGIRVGTGTGHQIYHNSVNLYGNLTGTGAAASAGLVFASTTTTGLDVRNNIFANTQTETGATTAASSAFVSILFTSSTLTSAYNLTLNNNDYFQGTAVNNGIAQAGTTAGTGFYTAANFDPATTAPATNLRAYTGTLSTAGTNDNASKVIDPTFISAVDLHIPTTSTLVNMGASVGVTNDIDNQLRVGVPDIGADEPSGTTPPANDIAATAITVPASGATFPTGTTVTPQATFTNLGTAAQTNVMVQFTISGPGGYSYSNTQTIASINSNQTVTVTFLPTMALTTAGTYTTTATVLTADQNSTNNTVSSSFTVVPPISGTISVGTGQTYTSLTNSGGIFSALNAAGASSNVIINITSDLTGETGAVALNELAGGFTVTIKPTGAVRTITGAAAGGLIILNGADNVTIDGSLSSGTDRSLTVINTGAGGVIQIASGPNGAGGNAVRNVNVSGNAAATISTLAGISVGGATVGSVATFANNNNVIENNTIQSVVFGIASLGASATVKDSGTIIRLNTMTGTGNNRVGRVGIYTIYTDGLQVTSNTISGIVNAESADAIGIAVGSQGVLTTAPTPADVTNAVISRNNIGLVQQTATFSAVGILLASGTTGTNTIVNNFVSGVIGNANSGDLVAGIYVVPVAGATQNIYYNSVSMTGDRGSATANQYPSIALVITADQPVNVLDNILLNTQTRTGSTGTGGESVAFGTINSTFANLTSNYNDLYVAGPNGAVGLTGGLTSTTQTTTAGVGVVRTTLTDFQTATGKDANSVSVDPLFASLTDLHLQATSPVINIGTPIATVTTDFDGQTRPATGVDIGADEIVALQPGTLALSAATYSVAENVSGGVATITVNRTVGTDGAVAVNYALTNGTATGGATCAAGVDFVNTGGTVSFANGVSTQTFTVAICNDAIFEGNETFNVTLSGATGGAMVGTPSTAVVTILDDEMAQPGTLQFNPATYSVGEAGPTVALTVTRTGGTDGAVGASYSLANGTATGGATCAAGVDFINTGGTVSFTSGQASQMFTVTICNDTLLEGNEMFTATLASATGGATLGAATTATVTILDDEVAQPGTLALSAATYSVAENVAGGTVTVTVNRTGGTDGAVGATYALTNGTATGGATCAAGVDFINAGGTVSFASGAASQTFTIAICNDTLLEGNETFNVTLSNATGGATIGTPATAVVTILDDEVAQPGTLALSSATYTVAENVSGGNLTVTVNRIGGTDGAVGATYALTNGTATGGATCAAGVDFINTGGTVSFANGVSTQTFTVAICNDTVFEGNETFNVTLSAATGGATIGTPATAMVTITDDEVAQNGTVAFSAATYTVTEAGPTATITINRTGGSDGSITVNYATVAGGTATGAAACAAGVDYVNTSGTATFGSGVTTPQTFTIPICNDTVVESSETVNLALTAPTGGATLGTPNTAVLTITDDDVAGLSGSYNVGTGQTYTSLTNTGGAFEALNTAGATGNITFNITSDLTAETGTVALNEVAGGFTVTIKPTGAARTISGSSTSGIIKLNGADFVTIDGSLTGGTATGIGGDPALRNLTIQNTSTTATAGSVITVSSTATTNIGAHDNTIKNVNVSGQDATQTLVGISLGGQAPGSAGTDNDNNRVENCSVQKAILGIYNTGASAANQNTGNVITRNDLSATGTSRLRRAGIFVFNQDGIQITENSVGGIADDESADAIGIIVGLQNITTTAVTSGNVTNALVSRNRINGIASTSTVGFSAAGIAVAGGTTGANTIANNFITGVNAPSTSPDLVAGIFVAGVPSSATRLYYNSVSITGDRGTVASQIGSYGVAISGTDPVVELKNNIFYTTQTSGGGTAAKSYAIGLNSTTFTNFNSNYNDYYSSGTNAGFFRTGGIGTTGTDYANLAAFRAATGSDANSKEVDPLFVDPLTNLHLLTTSPVLDMGTPVAGITVDYDGETRSATTPDIGADEVATVAQPGTLALSAATYSVAENVAGGTLTVTVNRTGGTDGAVGATYALTNGTATGGATCAAGVDFVNTGGTVSFANGVSTQTFTVAICNDAIFEGNETFNVTLSGATGGAMVGTPSTAVVTILDDEMAQPGTLQFNPATYSVGEAGPTVALTVTRTGGTDGAVGASYSLANGTATGGATCAAGVDFINTGGTVSFATGEASKTISVTICNDTLLEGNEMFTATLASATGGATLGAATTATVTILDDEVVQPGTLALSAATYTVSEAAASVTITVNRTGGTDGAVGATYALTNGTATGGATCAAGVDFINTGGTVSFASGAATQTFTVTLCPDALNKTDETFNVTLSVATGGATIGTPATAVVTITNDDAAPTISINSVSANEGNSGTTPFVFTATLSAASGQTVTVNYFTADGTASAGSDYTAIPNTLLTFAPGETTKTVTVLVNGDTVVEPNETFTVNLATPTNATIATAQGTGTIVNDDTAAVGSYSINDVRVVEGDNGVVFATFTVTLTNPNGQASSVQYATANGTATAGSDYNATSGTLNFAANEITKTITVTVIGDTVKEAYETFFVNLSNPVGATIGDNQGLGIIVDDDRAITADFDNDNKTDISVFRPSNGYWYVLQSGSNTPKATLFGLSGDLPVPGDYDGDGKVDIAVFRPSNGYWYILRSSDNGFTQTQFGFGNDKPVQGDYDGDGKTDIAVWRPSNGSWYILQSGNGQFKGVAFGANGDVPVQGDYDGDTKTDLAVYRSGVWYVFNSANSAVTALQFGAATDKALVGDFDGDGKTDYTVYRSGVWYIFQSLTNTSRAVTFGAATDIPTVGDYDGDGTADVAVFRASNGTWYILGSTIGFTATPFGQSGDIPIPTGYQSLQ